MLCWFKNDETLKKIKRGKGVFTMNNYALVYIEWEDAYSLHSDWNTESEIASIMDDESFVVKQTGFLLKETDRFIVLANQLNPLKQSDSQFSGLHRIPKGTLRKIEKIKVVSSFSSD